MPERKLHYSLSFRSPVGIFTGLGVAGLVDRIVVRDSKGIPYVPGSSVKGRLRFFVERTLRSGGAPTGLRLHDSGRPLCKEAASACTACRLFGNGAIPGLVRVSPARLGKDWQELLSRLLAADPNPAVHPDVEIRPGIAVSRQRRTVLPDYLFFDEAVPATAAFSGSLQLDGTVTELEERFLVGVGALVDALGARKAAGRGALAGGVRIGDVLP
ncbi:MAG TPA: RAMP superfamily CRISPR-associated protein [Thermoanaerobaculia bacterium]|nr:RAMP superfamily CRISPR-associated protein [Thermoanaerobaculia bacterium]